MSAATKRRHRKKPLGKFRSVCPVTRKIAYSSRKQALTGMNKARAKSQGSKPVAVYQCRDCGDWHMTSNPPRS